MDKVLSLENVSTGYWERAGLFGKRYAPVIRNLDLELGAGEKLGITGPNGCGKSTLLMLIAGTLPVDTGRIVNRCRHTALLTMNFALEPRLSGRINATLHGLYLGYRLREIRHRLDEIGEFAELGAAFDRPFHTYSAGMRSRLAFSVACRLRPELVLVDELFSTGDAAFREKSSHAFKEMLVDRSAILVSHNMQTLGTHCDRICRLESDGLRLLESS